MILSQTPAQAASGSCIHSPRADINTGLVVSRSSSKFQCGESSVDRIRQVMIVIICSNLLSAR